MITVEIPSRRTTVDFPDGTDQAEIARVMRENFPPTGDELAADVSANPRAAQNWGVSEFEAYRKFIAAQGKDSFVKRAMDAALQIGGQLAKGYGGMVKGTLTAPVETAQSLGVGVQIGTGDLIDLADRLVTFDAAPDTWEEFQKQHPDKDRAAYEKLLQEDLTAFKRMNERAAFRQELKETAPNPDVAEYGSIFLDPTTPVSFGSGAAAKVAAKQAAKIPLWAGSRLAKFGATLAEKAAEAEKAAAAARATSKDLRVGADLAREVLPWPARAGYAALQSAPATMEITGGALRGFGESLAMAPTRIGPMRQIAMTQSEMLSGKAARHLTGLDPLINFSGRAAFGAGVGATVGGGLGLLAEGEEGLASGLGSGAVLGAHGAALERLKSGAVAKITGYDPEWARAVENDWQSRIANNPEIAKAENLPYVSGAADDKVRSVQKWLGTIKSPSEKAFLLDMLGLASRNADIIISDNFGSLRYMMRHLDDATFNQWWKSMTIAEKKQALKSATRGATGTTATRPAIVLNMDKWNDVKRGVIGPRTFTHEFVHAIGKLSGYEDLVADIKGKIGGKRIEGKQVTEGIYSQKDLENFFTEYTKDLPDEARQRFESMPLEERMDYITEEIAAEMFSDFIFKQNKDYLLKGSNLTEKVMRLGVMRSLSERIGQSQDVVHRSVLFGELHGSPELNRMMHSLAEARRKSMAVAELAQRSVATFETKDLGNEQVFKMLADAGLAEQSPDGNRVVISGKRRKELDKQVTSEIVKTLEEVHTTKPQETGPRPDAEGNWSGDVFSPAQVEAILRNPKVPDKVKQVIKLLAEANKYARVVNWTYGAVWTESKKGKMVASSKIPISNRDLLPYRMEFKKDTGAHLVTAVDLSLLREKARRWFGNDPLYQKEWDTPESLYHDVKRYMANLHKRGTPSAELFGTPRRRDLLNKFLGVRNVKGNLLWPEGSKLPSVDNPWTTFRLDRVIEATQKTERARFSEPGYRAGQENFMPATNRITPEQDAAYLKAVKQGATQSAQRMVDETAKAAGYGDKKWSHGTGANFTVFKIGNGELGEAIYFAPEGSDTAKIYGRNGRTVTAYLKANPYELSRFPLNPVKESKRIAGLILDRGTLPKTLAGMNANDLSARIRETWKIEGIPKRWLEMAGFDAVTNAKSQLKDQIAVFSPEQVKSADPITFDNAGKVIPLSRRFNLDNNDIRYSPASPASDSGPFGKPERIGDADVIRGNLGESILTKDGKSRIFGTDKKPLGIVKSVEAAKQLLLRERMKVKPFWKHGLPEAQKVTVDPASGPDDPFQSAQRLKQGFELKDPTGTVVDLNRRTLAHWWDTAKEDKEVVLRLKSLSQLEETIKNPQEIWLKEGHRFYWRAIGSQEGKKFLLGFTWKENELRTFFINWDASFIDHKRKGLLLYARK